MTASRFVGFYVLVFVWMGGWVVGFVYIDGLLHACGRAGRRAGAWSHLRFVLYVPPRGGGVGLRCDCLAAHRWSTYL